MFSAMSEIMLDLYDKTTLLNQYDPHLHTKLKNLKVNFERTSKKAYDMFEGSEQLIFFDLIKVMSGLIEAATDHRDFSQLVGMIRAWHNNDITVINTKEELIATAKMSENDNL